mmetsp:Transcript_82413/g.255980  ORF Transcript_82413/g.255980 Transcript_82413/m.255980 type:complete len:309 (+) Transcript_82413:23-949(+)
MAAARGARPLHPPQLVATGAAPRRALRLVGLCLLVPSRVTAAAVPLAAARPARPPAAAAAPWTPWRPGGRPPALPVSRLKSPLARRGRTGRAAAERGLSSWKRRWREAVAGDEDEGLRRGDSVTCFLVILNLAVFLYERFPILGRGGYPLYGWRMQHHGARFRPFQLIASTFCHGDYRHLAGNLFGLYIFGRAVEEQCGASGLIVAYLVCGIFANLASLVFLRGHVVSFGASGVVFGLFVAATLAKLSPDWRSLVEFYVLGQFAWSQLQMELMGPSRAGVDHTAHIAGAVGGLLAYAIVRRRRREVRS